MIQVKAYRDWMMQRVRVVVRDPEAGIIFGRDDIYRMDELPPGVELPANAIAVDLSDRYFPEILAALNELSNGEKAPGDAYALRRDLDREHARVDQLLAVVIGELQREPTVTNVLQGPQGPMGPAGPPGIDRNKVP